jgi:AcrR family transcriptional regulator
VSSTAPTRRDEQRARTRRELLDAAASTFARQGYHATSVDEVAEAAGYTKGAVYSNFSSKEELFLELLDRQIDQAVAVVEDIFARSEPQDRPRLLGELHDEIQVLDRDWYLLETEFLLYAARNASVRDRVADRQRRTRERLTDLVSTHLEDLGIDAPAVAAEDAAQLLMAAADGLTQAGLVSDERARGSGRLLSLLAETLLEAATTRR